MALSVKRWSQRTLLYPIAIFAIIAPTVIMGLFGAYALREIELRPSLYRQDLANVQAALEQQLETRIGELALKPPANEPDAERARTEIAGYFGNYNRAIASRCYYGVNGKVIGSIASDGQTEPPVPPGLGEFVSGATGEARLVRRAQSLKSPVTGRLAPFVAYIDPTTGGFLAWELYGPKLDQLVSDGLGSIKLENEALSLDPVRREQLNWESTANSGFETVGYAPVHKELLPERFVVLKLNTDQQFAKDNKLYSTLFIVIAVLCVPIVSSATLMVVHMILREASEARKKVDFVSNVTHELKTPLTSIRMFVETLKLGRVKSEEQKQACLDVIMSETERLGALIDHVLSFSKVENQVKKYNIQPANIAQVVKDTVALFRAQIPSDHRDAIRLKVLPGLPSRAMFDKDAIREVLLNLLSNAIKYSADDKFVTVRVGVDRNDLFIEVADRGVGIPPEDQNRIFDKFYRVDQALSRKVDGTGLGLAICKEIIQAHDGRISLESMWGKGSRFTVFIPYKPPRAMRRPTTTVRQSTRETQIPAGEGV